jgi:hypothetical protein
MSESSTSWLSTNNRPESKNRVSAALDVRTIRAPNDPVLLTSVVKFSLSALPYERRTYTLVTLAPIVLMRGTAEHESGIKTMHDGNESE